MMAGARPKPSGVGSRGDCDGGAPGHAEMGALVVLADSRRCLDLSHQRHPCVGLAIMERVCQCPRPTVGELGAQHRAFGGGGDSYGGLCAVSRPSHRARRSLAEITLRGRKVTWRNATASLKTRASRKPARRKRRYDRRVPEGSIYFRGDLPSVAVLPCRYHPPEFPRARDCGRQQRHDIAAIAPPRRKTKIGRQSEPAAKGMIQPFG